MRCFLVLPVALASLSLAASAQAQCAVSIVPDHATIPPNAPAIALPTDNNSSLQIERLLLARVPSRDAGAIDGGASDGGVDGGTTDGGVQEIRVEKDPTANGYVGILGGSLDPDADWSVSAAYECDGKIATSTATFRTSSAPVPLPKTLGTLVTSVTATGQSVPIVIAPSPETIAYLPLTRFRLERVGGYEASPTYGGTTLGADGHITFSAQSYGCVQGDHTNVTVSVRAHIVGTAASEDTRIDFDGTLLRSNPCHPGLIEAGPQADDGSGPSDPSGGPSGGCAIAAFGDPGPAPLGALGVATAMALRLLVGVREKGSKSGAERANRRERASRRDR